MVTPTLEKDTLQDFTSHFSGEVIERGDARYDEARTIYNAMIDKHPRMIARCEHVADVISAVNFARENQLELAIHGGGHNGAGLAWWLILFVMS